MKKILIASLMTLSVSAFGADVGLDPQYLNVKIYKFAVSTSEFCTNPITIFENDAPVYEDMLLGPTLGSGNISNGIYKCVLIEMSDRLKFAPAQNSDSGGCALGVERTLDICRDEQTLGVDGVLRNCIVGEDRVTIYLSIATQADQSPENYDPNLETAFQPPTAQIVTRGITLQSALNVTGNGSRTFVVDGRGKVSNIVNDGQQQCELDAPTFSFR